VWNWVLVAAIDKAADRVVAFFQAPQPVQASLISPYTWKLQLPLATMILQVSSRQGLSHVGQLSIASCQQSM
jgi:hypothetical protein